MNESDTESNSVSTDSHANREWLLFFAPVTA